MTYTVWFDPETFSPRGQDAILQVHDSPWEVDPERDVRSVFVTDLQSSRTPTLCQSVVTSMSTGNARLIQWKMATETLKHGTRM